MPEKNYTVTIYIAAPGTALVGGRADITSVSGHMYYVISDGVTRHSYGFAPLPENRPIAAGRVLNTDEEKYQNPHYSRTMAISKFQYNILDKFGKDPADWGFDMNYNVATNCCVDFTWNALNNAEIFARDPYGNKKHAYEGSLLPNRNLEDIRSIQDPIPNSPYNSEHFHPIPKQTNLQMLFSSTEPTTSEPALACNSVAHSLLKGEALDFSSVTEPDPDSNKNLVCHHRPRASREGFSIE